MRTTTIVMASAIKAAVYNQDASSDHAARLQRISEMFLDMAADLEMCATDSLATRGIMPQPTPAFTCTTSFAPTGFWD